MSYLINQVTDQSLQANITASQIFNGPTYQFDGVDDKIDLPNANSINSDRLTIIMDVEADSSKTSGTGTVFGGLGTGAFTNRRTIVYNYATKKYHVLFGDSTGALAETGEVNGKISLIAVMDGPGNIVRTYVNGQLAAESSVPGQYAITGQAITIGDIAQIAGSSFFRGFIAQVKIYNRALSAAEVKQAASGQYFGVADSGATGTTLNSGTLAIGKRYEIVSFQSGDDFTNIGAASNATGQVFIASGSTPTTWTNSSILVQRGLTADYQQDMKIPALWYDISGNNYHATVTGAALNNRISGVFGPILNLQSLPTSASGLQSGRVWNDSGTLKIVA